MTFDVPHQQMNGLGQLAVMRAVPWAARTELEREIAEDALRDRQEAQGELLSGSHARRKKHLTLTPTSGLGPNFARNETGAMSAAVRWAIPNLAGEHAGKNRL